MQYTTIFRCREYGENGYIQIENCEIFPLSSQKHRLWVHVGMVRTASLRPC